jgi:hypothetical protein
MTGAISRPAWRSPGRPAAARRGAPKTVLRAGFGMFYDRFSLTSSLAAQRYNGIVQQRYVVANPDFFPSIPSLQSLGGQQQSQTIQAVSSTLRAPYIMQSALTLERQLPANTTLAATYTNSHGVHTFRSEDINAPLAGTYNPESPGSGVFPLGRAGPLLLMESSGVYNQNQFIVNVNSKINSQFSLFGFYALNKAMSNTDGLGTFPANPHRPAFANHPNKPGLIQTPYGLLDPAPDPSEEWYRETMGEAQARSA